MTVTGILVFGGGIRYISTRNFRRRIEQLERAREIQDERLRTRERIARDLHDDLASTVGSAGLYIETVRQQLTQAPAQAKEFLDKTGTLLSEAKDSISDIVWSVSPRHDTLESLLARVRILATDLCRANGIGIKIDLPMDGLEQSLPDEVRRNTYLILKEALTNSVKHSNAKSIQLSAHLNEKSLDIRLIDDGRGFAPPSGADIGETERHTGNGIRNMQERAKEIQADLVTESAPGKGTAIRLSVRMTQTGH
jgi:signal transduction histidine kinase